MLLNLAVNLKAEKEEITFSRSLLKHKPISVVSQ
jgi:hypothetical protein